MCWRTATVIIGGKRTATPNKDHDAIKFSAGDLVARQRLQRPEARCGETRERGPRGGSHPLTATTASRGVGRPRRGHKTGRTADRQSSWRSTIDDDDNGGCEDDESACRPRREHGEVRRQANDDDDMTERDSTISRGEKDNWEDKNIGETIDEGPSGDDNDFNDSDNNTYEVRREQEKKTPHTDFHMWTLNVRTKSCRGAEDIANAMDRICRWSATALQDMVTMERKERIFDTRAGHKIFMSSSTRGAHSIAVMIHRDWAQGIK